MFIFNFKYFLTAIILFVTEVFIAVYLHDGVIRPYGGDLLVVILLYCLAKSFLNTPVITTAGYVLLFAYGVEILQYFHFVKLIARDKSKIGTILLGNHFSWIDMVAYTLGVFTVVILEYTNYKMLYINKLS